MSSSSIPDPKLPVLAPTARLICKKIHYPTPTSKIDNTDEDDNDSIVHRKDRFRAALHDLFVVPLGATEIFVPDHRRKHYAIISFATPNQAHLALQSIPCPNDLFDELKVVQEQSKDKTRSSSDDPITVKKIRKLSPQEQQHKHTFQQLNNILSTTPSVNLVLQCTKSHLSRFRAVLDSFDDSLDSSTTTTPSLHVRHVYVAKTIVLIFLKVSTSTTPEAVVDHLHSQWYIQDNLQRSFIFSKTSENNPEDLSSSSRSPSSQSQSLTIQRLPDLPDTEQVIQLLLKEENYMSFDGAFRVRVEVYPPKIQSNVLRRLQEAMENLAELSQDQPGKYQATPDRDLATHTLNVLQLVPPLDDDHPGVTLLSLETKRSTSGRTTTTMKPPPSIGNSVASSATCRAYWKLAEACERYPFPLPTTSGSGMDVGAAPGGWTQYLCQAQGLNCVYSIDPGDMDEKVLALTKSMDDGDTAASLLNPNGKRLAEEAAAESQKVVQHVLATYQAAIPQIAHDRLASGQDHTPIQWYVSDMCVKTLDEQVDALLLAVKNGLVAKDTFLILTIKCTRGHSPATFDKLAQEQVDRIAHHLRDLHVLHLFSNRSSERTVMGYWKD